jgi:hypothetical protein
MRDELLELVGRVAVAVAKLESVRRAELRGSPLVVRLEVVREDGTVLEMADAYVIASPA